MSFSWKDQAAIGLWLLLVASVVLMTMQRRRTLRSWAANRRPMSADEFATRFFSRSDEQREAARVVLRFLESQVEKPLPYLQPQDHLRDDLQVAHNPIPFAADLSAAAAIDVSRNEVAKAVTIADLVDLVAQKRGTRLSPS